MEKPIPNVYMYESKNPKLIPWINWPHICITDEQCINQKFFSLSMSTYEDQDVYEICIHDFNWLVSYDIGDGRGGYEIDVRLTEAGWGVCEQGAIFNLLVRGREVGEKFVTE